MQPRTLALGLRRRLLVNLHHKARFVTEFPDARGAAEHVPTAARTACRRGDPLVRPAGKSERLFPVAASARFMATLSPSSFGEGHQGHGSLLSRGLALSYPKLPATFCVRRRRVSRSHSTSLRSQSDPSTTTSINRGSNIERWSAKAARSPSTLVTRTAATPNPRARARKSITG